MYGDYLQNAQGEDVVAGIRNTVSLADIGEIDKASHDELLAIMATLERHYRDMCDIEFTVEQGKLWMLQTRVGKRTAEAAFRIAVHMVDEGLIDMDEALRRVTGEQLAQLMFPRFDETAERDAARQGHERLPRRGVGKAVFDSTTAVEWAERGRGRDPRPQGDQPRRPARDDRGPRHPHQPRRQDLARRRRRPRHGPHLRLRRRGARRRRRREASSRVRGGTTVREGDVISIDGTTGEVFAGAVPVVDSLGGAPLRGRAGRRATSSTAVARLMEHADGARRLQVRANADTAEDAARARRFGAQGIGLCRTEHMFLGDRRQLVEHLILAEDDEARRPRSPSCCRCSAQDFIEILEAMDGLPVTIRLLDPPLHEFLPDFTELSVKVALAEARGERDEQASASCSRPSSGCTSRTRCSACAASGSAS